MFQGTKGYAGDERVPAMAAAEEEDGGPEGPNRERGGAGRARPSNVIYVWRLLGKLWSVCVATCTGENLRAAKIRGAYIYPGEVGLGVPQSYRQSEGTFS